MTAKVPIRTVFNESGTATGLAEFQTGEFIPVEHGGTGAVTHTTNAILLGNTTSAIQSSSLQISGSTLSSSDSSLITINDGLSITGALNVTGTITGTVSGNVTGDITGNADTATALETARTIAGQSFDGTGDITIASTDLSDTASIVLLNSSQTLTNKTLTTPVISSISNTGTLTLPTSTDTLVGRDTTDTLTNKTIDTANNTITVVEADISDLQSYILADSTDTLQNKTINLSDNTLTGTTAQFNSALSDGSFATLAGTETLTGKTINTASNTITVVEADISDLQSYILADSADTLENKTIALGSNTISGSLAEFNSALSDGSFASLAGTETLTNKTLTSPVISTITNVGTLTLPTSTDTLVGRDTTDTLTNKTISGASNTLSNIGNSSLTNSSITVTDGTTSTATSLGGTITFSGTANEIEVGESSGTLTFGLPDDVTIGNNLTISGNLTVSGTTTTVNTETINLADNTITLNSNETGTPSQDGGIEIERGTSTNKTLIWNETTDKWTVGSETFVAGTFEGNLTGNVTGDVTGNSDTATTLETARSIAGQSFDGSADITIASTDLSNTSDIVLLNSTQTLTNKTLTSPTITGTGAIAGTFTGNITGDVTGNADTATTLETARTIGGVSFDGSANINLPGVNTSGNQDTSGNAATATTLETARTIGGVSFNGSANIDLPGVNTSGNQDTSGNAATATALETARTIAGQSFDGTANITIASTDLSDTSSITLLTSIQTLTNKTIDADNNTITNIGDSELSSGISATKIGNGDVDNTELSYLNGVTSAIQTQIDTKASTAFAIAQAVALG